MKPIFVSYRRSWKGEVEDLANSLRRRGIRVTLDSADPADFSGPSMYDEMRRLIEYQCSAMLLHVTADMVDSSAVWNVEVGAAIKRSREDKNFLLLPFFRDLPPDQLRAMEPHGPLLAVCNGINAISPAGADVDDFLRQKRACAASLILERMLKGRNDSICLAIRTRETAVVNPDADLLLDWCSVYPEDLSPPAARADAQSALKQLAALLAGASIQDLRIQARTHLSAAVLLGSVFSRSAGFKLHLERDGMVWRSEGSLEDTEPRFDSRQLELEKKDLCLIVAVSRPEIVDSVRQSLPKLGINCGGQIIITPAAGIGRDSIRTDAEARRFAKSLASELMTRRSIWECRQTHLFISASVEVAVLIGHELNALGPIHIYEHNKKTDSYERAFTIC